MKKTSNKLLISHSVIGPTYKKRFLTNIENFPAYKYFDVLIMTDDVEYFSSISHMDNIFIEDIFDLRKDYPWSIEHEIFPKEKRDEVEYANELMDYVNITYKMQLPSFFHRFALNWKHSQEYKGFLFPCLDVHPIISDDEQFKKFESYFTSYNENERITFLPCGEIDKDHLIYPRLKEFSDSLNETLNINPNPPNIFHHSDHNVFFLKIPNENDIPLLFKTLNNICKEVILKPQKYFHLNRHSMWRLHAEHIFAIAGNLLEFEFPPKPIPLCFGSQPGHHWKICCYPEDRFWNFYYPFVFGATPYELIPSKKGQEDFIQNNFESLKAFYKLRFQPFPYIKK